MNFGQLAEVVAPMLQVKTGNSGSHSAVAQKSKTIATVLASLIEAVDCRSTLMRHFLYSIDL